MEDKCISSHGPIGCYRVRCQLGRECVAEPSFEQILTDHETNKARRAEQMPDDFAALRALQDVYLRFNEMGWNDAIYCPKDGSVFEVIEAGSTGIHRCMYMGEWPKGQWMTIDNGDLFPSRPILFRAIKTERK